ncbi:MAG: D-sedoheptulose 7-phosphate isomerase [Bacteriovoracaceae bacterium]|jgi:D-sedoheptulose 7-phosphate isomerase
MEFKHSELFKRHPKLESCRDSIEKSLTILIESFEKKGKLMVMGNGGSSADAEHMCGELTKGFLLKRPLTEENKKKFSNIDSSIAEKLQMGLPAFSLGVAHSGNSAFLNDVDPLLVYGQQIWVQGSEADTVMGITTSGNSKNVIEGFKVAKAMGLKTIGLTGSKDSLCNEWCDVVIQVPEEETYKAQELHLPVYHALCIELEFHFFG